METGGGDVGRTVSALRSEAGCWMKRPSPSDSRKLLSRQSSQHNRLVQTGICGGSYSQDAAELASRWPTAFRGAFERLKPGRCRFLKSLRGETTRLSQRFRHRSAPR